MTGLGAAVIGAAVVAVDASGSGYGYTHAARGCRSLARTSPCVHASDMCWKKRINV